MSILAQHHALATTLLAEVRAAVAPRPLTRREDLERWLAAFLLRASGRGYHVTAEEMTDLQAIEGHVHDYRASAVAA